MMLNLVQSTNAWESTDFRTVLKNELESLPVDRLPLQRCMTTGSHVVDEKPDVIILGIDDDGDDIRARVGVFFNGLTAGCSCADDPTPVEPASEYCELSVVLNKRTGVADVSPIG